MPPLSENHFGGHPARGVRSGQTDPRPSFAPAAVLCRLCPGPHPGAQPHPVPSRAARGLLFPGGPGSWLRAVVTVRVLCPSRSGTGWCEGLGSSVFRQPVHRMAAGPGAAPQGCPAPLPAPGSPGEDAHACLRMRLPRIRKAAYAPHVPVLLRVRLPFWSQVSLLGQLRLAVHRAATRAFRLSMLHAAPVVPVAWGRCCAGSVAPSALAVPLLFLSLQP